MKINSLKFLREGSTISDALKSTNIKPFGVCFFVNDNGKLLSIFTDGDLRRALQNTEDLANKKVGQIMTETPQTISPQKNLGEALELMEKRNPSPISILPVVNPEDLKFLGLIRLHDILGV